jgi:hypothetical protein
MPLQPSDLENVKRAFDGVAWGALRFDSAQLFDRDRRLEVVAYSGSRKMICGVWLTEQPMISGDEDLTKLAQMAARDLLARKR